VFDGLMWLCCWSALAGLLGSMTPTTPLPPTTPQSLADLNGLFSTSNQSLGHQLLGANTARDSSPISAAAVAAAGLLGAPPPGQLYTHGLSI